MIAANPNSICKQAQANYYEYLCGEPRECIPTEIVAHIDKCSFCQAEVNRLKTVLAEAEERAGGSAEQTTAVITANLKLHFVYLRALVSCNTARLFLPSLVIPGLEITVPTPITVHLDKCQQCANDLEAIRELRLTHKQLCRLGQLFTEESALDTNICGEARNAIDSVGAMDFEGTSAAILRHLCVCPECRKLLYEDRKARKETISQNSEQSPIPCGAVSAADIFDYVVPYGIDPDNDQYVMFRESLTSHLINCPICLDKMQQLHRTVYDIIERPDSEVVTCFTFEERIDKGIEPEAGDLYADWPINVQVLDKAGLEPEISSADIGFPRSLKQRVTELNLRPFIKPIAVAAAVILAALILLNVPVAKAVSLGQIREALERIKNVCITTFYQEEPNPTQEIWISRTLKVKMFRAGTQCVLWDLNGKFRKSKDLNTGSITAAELDKDALLKVAETMEGPLGLLPFNDMPEAPKSAKWQAVANENIETTIPGTQVFDLMWTEKGPDGSIVHNKWRGYIDTETKLPRKVERWEKRAEEEFKLLTIIKVVYPTAVEIQAVIRNAGF